MRIILLFVDGVGLGPADRTNPFASSRLPTLERLAGEQRWTAEAGSFISDHHVFRRIDATLGVEGLPQSGTGQATLFTGVNCAKIVGRHFGPFPHSATRGTIAAENVFRKVRSLETNGEINAAFANAYPERFFEYVRQRNRWTVTTLCCLEAGVPIRSLAALKAGEAVTADLTGAGWQPLGYGLPPVSEREAGRRLAGIARRHAFTVFEYYQTDKAGHSRSQDQAVSALQALDRFAEGLIEHLDPEETLLLITSDHGNIENLSLKTHTLNAVPLIAYGEGAVHFSHLESILDITPAIISAISR